MAKHKNKKSAGAQRPSRGSAQSFVNEDIDMNQDQDTEMDMMGDESGEAGRRDVGVQGQGEDRAEFDPKQLLDSFRDFVEGHPGRATALGAVVGGVAAGLLATDTGRSLLRASFSYARPMISDYARKFVSNSPKGGAERSLPQ